MFTQYSESLKTALRLF